MLARPKSEIMTQLTLLAHIRQMPNRPLCPATPGLHPNSPFADLPKKHFPRAQMPMSRQNPLDPRPVLAYTLCANHNFHCRATANAELQLPDANLAEHLALSSERPHNDEFSRLDSTIYLKRSPSTPIPRNVTPLGHKRNMNRSTLKLLENAERGPGALPVPLKGQVGWDVRSRKTSFAPHSPTSLVGTTHQIARKLLGANCAILALCTVTREIA